MEKVLTLDGENIRWKQRYNNFHKAMQQLTEFAELETMNKFEVQGLIQCFEYTFELAWKTLKDYLELEGFEVKSPRSAIQIAFQIELIENGHMWLDALSKRNLMAHTYDEAITNEAKALILEQYYGMMQQLLRLLGEKY